MTWLRAIVVLLFLATRCAPRAETPLTVAATLAIQQLQLDNGLLVVLDPDPTAPSAFVDVRYHVGFKDDPVGRAGLAHLVEHLTFAPTQGAGDLDRMATLEHFGAVDVNGTTSFDVTDYYATVPPPLLAQALWVEASRMAGPLVGIDENALRRERAVVKNELRASHGRHAYGLATLLIAAALYGKDHPYGRIANHTRSEVDRATLDEVQAFAIRHYRPANATLVVSGRFDVEAVRALVARSFGPLPSGPAPAREVLPAARLSKDDVATFGASEGARGGLAGPAPREGRLRRDGPRGPSHPARAPHEVDGRASPPR